MPITPLEYLGLAVLGFIAGTLGGLLGVGGSLLVVPSLLLLFPFDGQPTDVHLAFSAAMVMNACVGAMSAYRHWRAGTMQPVVTRWLVPAAIAGVIVGVLWSNRFETEASKNLLRRLFGLFCLYVAGYNSRQFLRSYRQVHEEPIEPAAGSAMNDLPAPPPLMLICYLAGLFGGLLGIGGGGVAVPFQQLFLRLPLKNAIGNSALVVFTSSLIGAVLKLITASEAGLLPAGHGLAGPLWMAAGLVPTSMLGAYWGAFLTHVLPTHWVLAPFVVLMLLMGGRMVLGG